MTKRFTAILFALLLLACSNAFAQDWIRTGTGLGVEKIRLAASDFKLVTNDSATQALASTFNTTLWNDLQFAGIFDMVSKSGIPCRSRRSARRCGVADWGTPPPNVNMLVFGNVEYKASCSTSRAGCTTRRTSSRRRCWASSIARNRATPTRG